MTPVQSGAELVDRIATLGDEVDVAAFGTPGAPTRDMTKRSRRNADQAERSLHTSEARGHLAVEAASTLSGAALGAIVGSIAGPPGAFAGAVVGGAIGAVTGVGLDRGVRSEERAAHDIEDIEREADHVIERRSTRPPKPAVPPI